MFDKLRVYKDAYELGLSVHRLTLELPQFEKFELGRQIRRAAVSIPLNIAEGYGRKRTQTQFAQFVSYALGSCNELGVLLSYCHDLGYVSDPAFKEIESSCSSVGKQLTSLLQTLDSKGLSKV